MNLNQTMRNQTFCMLLVSFAGLILIAGCEKTYEPAAYKAAPRVDAGQPIATGNSAKANLPDITDWTSPDALRKGSPAPNGVRGYSGIRSYRGNARRGYSGLENPYRGYVGQDRAYRGIQKPTKYRGYGQQRSYRGRR